jgi:hypothetical protein
MLYGEANENDDAIDSNKLKIIILIILAIEFPSSKSKVKSHSIPLINISFPQPNY